MFQHLRSIVENLPNDSKVAASFGGISGWMCNLFLLDISPLSLEFFIRGFMGIGFTIVGAIGVVIAKDFYTEKIKSKLFKNAKKDTDTSNKEAA